VPEEEMDQARIEELRSGATQRSGLALVLYLDLPDADLEKWANRCNVLAVDGSTAADIEAVLDVATEATVSGIEDEAARAISLFASAGPDSQAFAIGLIEALVSLTAAKRDALSGFNVFASTTIEEAQRRLGSASSCEQEHLMPDEVERIMKECERFLADRRGL
jgi:hypothetical protein